MTTLDPAGRNLLFNEARTHNGWTDQPVSDDTLRELFGSRADGVDSISRHIDDGQGTSTNSVLIGATLLVGRSEHRGSLGQEGSHSFAILGRCPALGQTWKPRPARVITSAPGE
jgi:hypothetical protein